MLKNKITGKTAKVCIAALIFFVVVWLYPVHMKNIVLWMDTSEETEAVVVSRLFWDAGEGYSEERLSENAIVAQEIFVRVPRRAMKEAKQYRLTLQNEEKDITIYKIRLNGDEISAEKFLSYVESTENLELEQQGEYLVAHVQGTDPTMTFDTNFTNLVKRKWHMANVTRLWLSIAGAIATIWGLIYVKMEDEE